AKFQNRQDDATDCEPDTSGDFRKLIGVEEHVGQYREADARYDKMQDPATASPLPHKVYEDREVQHQEAEEGSEIDQRDQLLQVIDEHHAEDQRDGGNQQGSALRRLAGRVD